MKKIGYLRVSTSDQRLDRQIDGLKGLCDEYYLEVLSAVSRKRPVYESVISQLKPGDALVVWDFDRAFRSVADAFIELDALRARGVKFHIATLQIDTETANGRYHYGQMSLNAQYEREKLIERTKEGLAAARRRGVRLGRPPKLTPVQLFDAHCRIAAGVAKPAQIATEHGMAPWSLTRAINRSLKEAPN
ncbi:recombinase family protein [Corticibacterium sp. UT-5YL-CI-8]|nr:recombinase family protein [Tianweitania sp. UT-5YL-CI-8]